MLGFYQSGFDTMPFYRVTVKSLLASNSLKSNFAPSCTHTQSHWGRAY